MRNKPSWRKGDMGLPQIMATLLVVLPTIAFITTLIFEYWTIMQADYKLKLIANMTADYVNSKEDATVWGSDYTDFLANVNNNNLCPNGTTLGAKGSFANDEAQGVMNITIEYKYTKAVYITDKTLSTSMITYSYHDQNLSATLECT